MSFFWYDPCSWCYLEKECIFSSNVTFISEESKRIPAASHDWPQSKVSHVSRRFTAFEWGIYRQEPICANENLPNKLEGENSQLDTSREFVGAVKMINGWVRVAGQLGAQGGEGGGQKPLDGANWLLAGKGCTSGWFAENFNNPLTPFNFTCIKLGIKN